MTTATVKNWAEFQHYKDRSPPWLKLHRKLLDDRTFQTLPIASKALAPMLWLLAAENMEGRVDITPEELVFRLRWKLADIQAGLPALIEKGFLIVDSKPLAPRLQPAAPETETEGDTETEKALSAVGARFEEFWSVYPNKKGVSEARKKWASKKLDPLTDQIILDVRSRMLNDPDWLRGAIPHGSTYVNQERWLDAVRPDALPQPLPVVAGNSPAKVETPESRAQAAADFARYRKELGYAAE